VGSIVSQRQKLRLDICINYLVDDTESGPLRNGKKWGTTSVTKTMLTEREARIDAEQSSGQYSAWRDVYKKMRGSGSPCKNKEGYCWQDPVGKKHYKLKTHHLKRLVDMVKKNHLDLETHHDAPDEIRQQLYAEEQQILETTPCPPININFLPTLSPQPSMMATPAGSPPLLPYLNSGPIDPIAIPDLPLYIE